MFDSVSRVPILMALAATLGTWFVTAVGAATVLLFRKASGRLLTLMLGFASGVMLAASYWSLLEPAILRAAGRTVPAYITVAVGFLAGGFFILFCDALMQKRSIGKGNPAKRRLALLVASITLHNIPEGLAVGVAFGTLRFTGISAATLVAPVSLAIGIGLQNFPEGAAVSIPLRKEGLGVGRSFMIGQLSGIVEPIAGVLGALLVTAMEAALPFALAFAAGAMILVVVKELIPEAGSGRLAAVGSVVGFTVMMVMDVALG